MTKINISIPQEVLNEIDKVSKEENLSRSELLRMAFKIYLEVLKEERREKKKQKRYCNWWMSRQSPEKIWYIRKEC